MVVRDRRCCCFDSSDDKNDHLNTCCMLSITIERRKNNDYGYLISIAHLSTWDDRKSFHVFTRYIFYVINSLV